MREATLLSSLAVSIVAREVMTQVFGSEMQTIPQSFLLQNPIRIGALSITDGDVVIFAASVIMLGALQFMLFRTRIGLSIRAVADSPLGAQFVGINTDRAIMATFAVGSMLGAVAGILVGLYSRDDHPADGIRAGDQGLRRHGHGRVEQHPRRGDLRFAARRGREHHHGVSRLGLAGPGGLRLSDRHLGLLPTGAFRCRPRAGLSGGKAHRVPPAVAKGLLAVIVFVAVPATLSAIGGGYLYQIATKALIFIILAASLNLVTGTAGLLSLGHAGFYGIGAYAAAILSTRLGLSFLITLPAAGLAAGAIGVVVALPTMRLVSIYFAVATLGHRRDDLRDAAQLDRFHPRADGHPQHSADRFAGLAAATPMQQYWWSRR